MPSPAQVSLAPMLVPCVTTLPFSVPQAKPGAEQVTCTVVTSAVGWLPDPFVTTQVCAGEEGCVATVTE